MPPPESSETPGVLLHPFERVNLGSAPFRCTGMRQRRLPSGQPAGTCAYCGTGILYCFDIVDVNGKAFYVGSDCVLKTCSAYDRSLNTEVLRLMAAERKQQRNAQRVARLAKLQARIGRARETLAANPSLFADAPHPSDWHASQGKTERDYIEWLLSFAGQSGRVGACKQIERATAPEPANV